MYEIGAYQGMLRGNIWTWASCYKELEVKNLTFFSINEVIFIFAAIDTEKGLKDFHCRSCVLCPITGVTAYSALWILHFISIVIICE